MTDTSKAVLKSSLVRFFAKKTGSSYCSSMSQFPKVELLLLLLFLRSRLDPVILILKLTLPTRVLRFLLTPSGEGNKKPLIRMPLWSRVETTSTSLCVVILKTSLLTKSLHQKFGWAYSSYVSVSEISAEINLKLSQKSLPSNRVSSTAYMAIAAA